MRPLIALALIVAAVAVGTTVALAGARTAGRALRLHYGVDIQAVFDAGGNPSLVANFSPDGALATPAWTLCRPAPAAGCRTVHSRHAFLEPGPEPAGTRFIASATYRGQTYRSSVTWQGPVRPLTPPRVLGDARAGASIRAAAGTWTGGWGTEFDQLGLEACRMATAHGCVTLSGGQYGCPARSSATVVGGSLARWYLFALDLRSARDEACAGVGYPFPAAIPPWPRQPIVARSGPLGPVVGPPPPKVSILPVARVAGARVLVASIRCATRCHVWLDVSDATSGSWNRTSFSGAETVGVPRRDLHPGTLRVTIHIDDGPVLSGTSRLRPDGQGARDAAASGSVRSRR